MTSANLGHHIARAPRALIEYPRTWNSPAWEGDVAVSVDGAGRQAPRTVIRRELVVVPSATPEASFIQHGRVEGVVPNCGPGLREPVAGPFTQLPRPAIDGERKRRHPINAERDQILLRRLVIQPAVVLGIR